MLTPPSSWGVDICQAQLGFESRELSRSKGLGEYVNNLHSRSNGQQFEETINFNVLGAFMKDLIGRYLKGIFVVTVQGCRLGERKM